MTKAEMEKYKDKKPIAVYPMSNWGGIEILDIEYGIDDYVICRFNFGEPEDKLHRVKVTYGARSTTIYVDGTRIRLGDCMRVG